MMKEVREVQCENAESLMVVRLLGDAKIKELKEEHCENAQIPMLVTLWGMVTEVISS